MSQRTPLSPYAVAPLLPPQVTQSKLSYMKYLDAYHLYLQSLAAIKSNKNILSKAQDLKRREAKRQQKEGVAFKCAQPSAEILRAASANRLVFTVEDTVNGGTKTKNPHDVIVSPGLTKTEARSRQALAETASVRTIFTKEVAFPRERVAPTPKSEPSAEALAQRKQKKAAKARARRQRLRIKRLETEVHESKLKAAHTRAETSILATTNRYVRLNQKLGRLQDPISVNPAPATVQPLAPALSQAGPGKLRKKKPSLKKRKAAKLRKAKAKGNV